MDKYQGLAHWKIEDPVTKKLIDVVDADAALIRIECLEGDRKFMISQNEALAESATELKRKLGASKLRVRELEKVLGISHDPLKEN